MPQLALIGLVLAGYYAYSRLRNGGSALDLSAPGGTSFDESSVGSDGGSFGGGGGGASVSGQSSLATNDGWAQVAINGLIQQGYDPSSVEQAIADFLNGGDLSQAEQALVNKALLEYGAPPALIAKGGGTTNNPTSNPTAPTGTNPPPATYDPTQPSPVSANPIISPTPISTIPPPLTVISVSGSGPGSTETVTNPSPTGPPTVTLPGPGTFQHA